MGQVTISIESDTQTTQELWDLATAMVEGTEMPDEVEVKIIPSNED